ncbi:SprT-like domain-containing protein [Pelolinea submarina]|uniref:SprT-like family protein n=1 Tax=Pelolinea submarina TaxID=913107 RepID=A0A347ZUX1_9CHLR|nr:SprT-like domain-containing protein [Pelolinea submarina]REG10314.1 SprT-like family protein [Pelolinea submarina]BBB49102.1 hypothetical protein Pelsub_P2333 [Pelolinea submarina]
MRISNLVSTAHSINHSIEAMVLPQLIRPQTVFSEEDLGRLSNDVSTALAKTHQLCQKMNGKPEDLPTPSFRAYQWLKFIEERDWLFAHAHAIDDFYRLLPPLFPNLKLGNISKSLEIEIYHSAYLFRSSQKGRKVFLEVNEGFIQAPTAIKQTLLETALKRRTVKRLNVIKAYTGQADYRVISAALQANNGGNRLAGRGKYFDLTVVFGRVNNQYFEGSLSQPRLTWSSRRTTRRLGAYHPESDTITINRRLDSADIPLYLLEYVMYHEMLHKKIGLKEVNGRRYAHTKIFRDAERKFESYQQAEALIKELNQKNLF